MTVDFFLRECGIKVLGMEASMSRYVVASWQLRVRAFAALGRGGFTPGRGFTPGVYPYWSTGEALRNGLPGALVPSQILASTHHRFADSRNRSYTPHSREQQQK